MHNFFRFSFLSLALFSSLVVFAQKKPAVAFESVLLEKDIVVEGSKGIRITGKCNFLAYKANYNSDSLMMKAFLDNAFYLTITPMQKDSVNIKPALGHNAVFAEEKVSTKLKMKPASDDVKSGTITFSWFVPYASLKLNAGEQDLAFSVLFYGKDGFNNVISGKYKTEKIAFQKPKTRTFEVQLDSLTVNTFDNNGELWDVSFSSKVDKPDLKWTILLGDKELGSIQKGNSSTINFGKKPRIFKFTISENDEVYIYLTDEDDFQDDPIANWKYNTSNMKDDVVYKQEEKKANLASFSFSCKAGPLK